VDLEQQGQEEVLQDVKEEKDGDEGVALNFKCKEPFDLFKVFQNVNHDVVHNRAEESREAHQCKRCNAGKAAVCAHLGATRGMRGYGAGLEMG
jgi:hypothetical protein